MVETDTTKQMKATDDDRAEVIMCAGPPLCLLQGDEAIANAQAGCPSCKHIVIRQDGSEHEYSIKAN